MSYICGIEEDVPRVCRAEPSQHRGTANTAAQIDPLTWGEHQRAVSIALGYGERLAAAKKSLKDNALLRLVTGYPSHTFVIDRSEAKTLFNNVKRPEGEQETLDMLLRTRFCYGGGAYVVQRTGRAEVRDLKEFCQSGERDGTDMESDAKPGGDGQEQNARGDGAGGLPGTVPSCGGDQQDNQ